MGGMQQDLGSVVMHDTSKSIERLTGAQSSYPDPKGM